MNGDMPSAINKMMVHFGSQEMVEAFGEIFPRCMSLCLGHMDMIRYPTSFFFYLYKWSIFDIFFILDNDQPYVSIRNLIR